MQGDTDFAPFWHFINERHAIWLRKHYLFTPGSGAADPLYRSAYDPLGPGGIPDDPLPNWCRQTNRLTRDDILHTFRFCNVFRELDRVTIWIDENIRKPFADHPNLWFMLAIARTINWPDTLAYLMNEPGAWPNDDAIFKPEKMGAALDAYKALGNKVYTGAYMIRAESDPKAEWYSWTKQQYVARIVLGRLWEDRDRLQGLVDQDEQMLEQVWRCILTDNRYVGWGPFMTFQWVLELRHTRYLKDASDASSWAAIGPGSMRGLNRLHGRFVGDRVSQEQAMSEMTELLRIANQEDSPLLPHVPKLEVEDIQNSLCETDKYLRVKTNGGTPRSKYIPGRGF